MADINQFITLFKSASSNDPKLIAESTNSLKEAVQRPRSLITLLQIVESDQVDGFVRQLAAIYFKNHIKDNWKKDGQCEHPISNDDKNGIKGVIINLILKVPANVKIQLIEAMTFIGEAEFPMNWNNLLPEMMNTISSSDYPTVNTLLQVLNTLLLRYRSLASTETIIEELAQILKSFSTPYLNLFIKTTNIIKSGNLGSEELKLIFNSIYLQLEIFLSMNSIDLPEFFEDNLSTFATQFLLLLNYRSTDQNLILGKNEDDPSLLDKIQTSICDIVNLYIGVYDEEFSSYLQPFVQAVWTLLSQTPNQIKYDSLTYSSIKFLGTVSMSIRHNIFEGAETLKQICSCIVTPNIKLREADIELFEDNQIEYIRRDIEGSDSDTRRRASIELVKGLRKYFEQQVTQLLSVDINQLLTEYRANPTANWASKDSAIFLVTALAIKSEANKASGTNSLVPIVDFFKAEIVPEIANAKKTNPILLADCLKFISIFRSQLPAFEDILKLVVPCLQNPNYVIHTYAATCIDRLITTRDANKVPRLSVDYIYSVISALLPPLVGVLAFPDSHQNERAMRTIVRVVLLLIGKIDIALTVDLLNKFTSIVRAEADNPINHTFNHYCFEAIGSLLKSFADRPEAFQIVTPLIHYVLTKDVVEFSPYTFQLLAILLENASPQHMAPYRELLAPLYHPNLFKHTANIPPLVRLYQAYFKKDGQFIVENGHLEPILGVFKMLIASPVNDHEGFYLVETIVQTLSLQSYDKYIIPIFQIILERISKHKTEKLLRCFIVFLGLFIHKLSIAKAITIVNTVKPGLWSDVISKVWIVTCEKVTGHIEKKILSVAMTEMLCSPEMFTSIQDSWVYILECQYKLLDDLSKNPPTRETTAVNGADEQEASTVEKADGYVPSFAQLQFTKKPDVDPISEITDSRQYFALKFNPIYQSNRNSIDQLLIKCSSGQEIHRFLTN